VIRGYPRRASVVAGERLLLHVATDAQRFRVSFYRWGDGFTLMRDSPWLAGKEAAPGCAGLDWNWPAYEFRVPRDWPSAVYIAHLQEWGVPMLSLALNTAAALFVVRGEARSALLYKIPLATYHAYNCTGGACFYSNPPRSMDPPGSRVSLRRPGGGIGGDTWGAIDYYDSASPRQTFAHWDAPFIRWLTRHGYAPDFCTDLDLHHDPGLARRYRLLLSVGHDEYWTENLRDGVEAFVAAGGNLAFFGANVCWWRIHLAQDATAIVCHQGGPAGALDHWWPGTGAHRPEDGLSGVSYRHGGGWWDGPRRSRGYVVQQAAHWAFAGTGLSAGQAFGTDSSPPLVGYECDGAPLEHLDAASGLAVLSGEAASCGTPPDFCLLAACPLGADWQELPRHEAPRSREDIHAATMGVHTRNGTVFTAATTDWAQVLASGHDRCVETITRNVIGRLLGP
jgi:hypothetical protein